MQQIPLANSGRADGGPLRPSMPGCEGLYEKGRSSALADRLLVGAVKSLIEEHYAEPPSLTRLASQIGVSRFALYRKFKAVEGASFREYLLHVRLTKALELLSARQHTVTEVAQMVGFGALSRFDKVFKRATRSTPSAYRGFALADAFLKRLRQQPD